MAGALDQHLSRAPHGRHRRAEPGPFPHRPRGDLLRPHNAQVELRLVALVSNVVRHHIHGVADDDLAFNPGHAISCAPDLLPSDPAACTTGRGKGPRPTPPRHTRARTGTGVQGRAITARHARFLHPAAQPTAPIRRDLADGGRSRSQHRRIPRPTTASRPVPPHRADGRHRATPTGGITLSDREVRENARRAADLAGNPSAAAAMKSAPVKSVLRARYTPRLAVAAASDQVRPGMSCSLLVNRSPSA